MRRYHHLYNSSPRDNKDTHIDTELLATDQEVSVTQPRRGYNDRLLVCGHSEKVNTLKRVGQDVVQTTLFQLKGFKYGLFTRTAFIVSIIPLQDCCQCRFDQKSIKIILEISLACSVVKSSCFLFLHN